MTRELSNHKPHARVAGASSYGIDGVDGALSTHTTIEQHPDLKGTADVPTSGPLPFFAVPSLGSAVVGLMTTVVGALTTVALAAVVDASPEVAGLALVASVALVLWAIALMIPAVMARVARRHDSPSRRSRR